MLEHFRSPFLSKYSLVQCQPFTLTAQPFGHGTANYLCPLQATSLTEFRDYFPVDRDRGPVVYHKTVTLLLERIMNGG